MPAAQERGTRDTHCFFTTISGPNRWSKSTESTARGSRDRIPTVQEELYQSEYDQLPPEGFAARRSREVPHPMDRTTRHVLRKTTWNFVLPSDNILHDTMTRSLSSSCRQRYSFYQRSKRHVTLLSTSDGTGFSFMVTVMVSILGETA